MESESALKKNPQAIPLQIENHWFKIRKTNNAYFKTIL